MEKIKYWFTKIDENKKNYYLNVYLSRMKLAFAKHNVPELIRIIMMPGILVATEN